MRTNKRQMSLNEVKSSFRDSGYVDWHINIRVSNTEDPHHEQGDVAVQTAPPEVKRPPMYAVILLNDDYTPMDFVIEILQQYFALNLDQATQVMLTVHYEGKGEAGVYPRDIAETKANQVNNYARSQGHPLLCQIEPKE
ncbi:ATP-dependent Clp protease adapter ClpS [Acinetobacter sp.]|jgi:ATP-dependent Clp protease adaptor protein ClpS|uniref:ATP-dependent Clp protease adapter ClpS n=1 Tax=Acinetobacter sp. TaxID=472 RepID=UPI002830D834|nr:ATP-dependent Clp protease adapter ClpS [Acinetobacter sp.]MDR0235887.1 ATP-dependent Clp protease adapter ClpS [Acinetobacter sp.]